MNKKIDFSKLVLIGGIAGGGGHPQDVRETFADVIYKCANGIAALELARKIYNSQGEVEYTEQEVRIIRDAAALCTPQFIESVYKVLDKKED